VHATRVSGHDLAGGSGIPLEPLGGQATSKEHRHARRRVWCGGWSLIGVDGPSAGVYPFRCHRWRCSTCGSRKVNQTRKRIRAGLDLGETWFLTLTSPGPGSPGEALDQLTRRWKALRLRLTRKVGRVEYVAVVELQRRGHPHLHLLVRGPLVSGRWIATAAAEVGFGRIADLRRPPRGVAGYLTKAIGPNTSGDSLPAHFRRVRWSRGWSLPVQRRAKRAWQAWYVAFAETGRAAASAIQRGYHLVELVHGPPNRRATTRPVRWLSLAVLAGK
jgi:hypothetical protein